MKFAGETLRKLREAKDMSQAEVAELVGVSRVSILHWEKGFNSPSLEKISILGGVLGVPAKYFLED